MTPTPSTDQSLVLCVYMPVNQERELEEAVAILKKQTPALEDSDAPDLIFAAGIAAIRYVEQNKTAEASQ